MLYFYTARDHDGRFRCGSLWGQTEADALLSLRARSLFVSSLEKAGSARGSVASLLLGGRISPKTHVVFLRSLATLVRAGVSLQRSFAICIKQCRDKRMREALEAVAADIETGLSLSESLGRRPREFSSLSVAMIRAGEYTGLLDEVLERLAGTIERDLNFRRHIRAALSYPAVVVAAAFCVVVLIVTTVIPVFRTMYDQLHVSLPPILRIMVAMGEISPRTLVIAVAFLGAIVVLTRQKEAPLAAVAELTRSNLPIVGGLLRKASLARLARALGALLSSGVSLNAALPVVADLTDGPRFRSGVELVRSAIIEGKPLSEPLSASVLYEPLFLQLVRVGEETGTLAAMLVRVADYYDRDVDAALQTLGVALEPILILVLGGGVAFIAASVFIPLYSLIGSMK